MDTDVPLGAVLVGLDNEAHRRVVLGSVSHPVLRRAECPVLLVVRAGTLRPFETADGHDQ